MQARKAVTPVISVGIWHLSEKTGQTTHACQTNSWEKVKKRF
jgi:hypothetical protein